MCIIDVSHALGKDPRASHGAGKVFPRPGADELQGLPHLSRNTEFLSSASPFLSERMSMSLSCSVCLPSVSFLVTPNRSLPKCPGCGNRTHLTGIHGAPWGFRTQNIIPDVIANSHSFLGLSFLPWRMGVGVSYTWEDLNHAVSLLSVFGGCARHM